MTRMNKMLIIEDHVVPQLFTTAIEAYEFEHKAHKNGKAHKKLETFGLLWGYSIPEKGKLPDRTVATIATTETSALRHQDWVEPIIESIITKKNFFEKYWPNIELVGTFHSHPYASLTEVKENKGWRASFEDQKFWPWFHKMVSPEQPLLAHLIITITKLEKKGWAYPDRLKGVEENRGYVLSAEDKKLWLRAYLTEVRPSDQEIDFSEDLQLEIPALQRRFWEYA